MKFFIFIFTLILTTNAFANQKISKKVETSSSHTVSIGKCSIKDTSIDESKQIVVLEITSCNENIVADFNIEDRKILDYKIGTKEVEIPGSRRIVNKIEKDKLEFERSRSFLRSGIASDLALNQLNVNLLMMKCENKKEELERKKLSIYQTNCSRK